MNIAYIISEYNPLHNGHVYHINETKKALQPEAVVCVMSGNFTQRGSPAIVDKWARTKMALLAGADLVIELHAAYASSSAEFFALGAINAINALNFGGCLSFGAESVDIGLFNKLADIVANESPEYKEILTSGLRKGLSFAKARALAAEDRYFEENPNEKGKVNLEEFLKSPNIILAIEYIKAIKKTNSIIKPHIVKRAENNHNDVDLNVGGQMSSASAIRNRILKAREGFVGRLLDDAIKRSIPDYTADILKLEALSGKGFMFDMDFFCPLIVTLRRMTVADIRMYPDVSDGLAERIYAAAGKSGEYEGFMEGIVTKRYPTSRIRRTLTHILLNIKKSDLDEMDYRGGCPYIKVLGFTDTGRWLLSRARQTATVPIITTYSATKSLTGPRSQMFVAVENRATDIYSAMYKAPEHRASGREYTQPVIMVNNKEPEHTSL